MMLDEKFDGKMAKAGMLKKNVASFSGGRTSAYMCYLLKEKFGNEVDFVFIDTGAEHPKTYDFIKKVDSTFGLRLTYLRPVIDARHGVGSSYMEVSADECKFDMRPFIDLMVKCGTPSYRAKFCTSRLKSTPMEKYKIDKYGKNNYLTWLGIRADEPRRLTNKWSQSDIFGENNDNGIRYLADISDFCKEDVLAFWKKMPFDLEIKEHLGNCVFCIHKSKAKLALAAMDEPELAKQWIDATNRSDIRVQASGKHPMYSCGMNLDGVIASTMVESREYIEQALIRGKKYDTGSCTESCEAIYEENLSLFDN